MMHWSTEIKKEYRQAWLSEYMPYRLDAILGKFDAELSMWRNLSGKMDANYHAWLKGKKKTLESTFEELFLGDDSFVKGR